jgi:hypothetical protein
MRSPTKRQRRGDGACGLTSLLDCGGGRLSPKEPPPAFPRSLIASAGAE